MFLQFMQIMSLPMRRIFHPANRDFKEFLWRVFREQMHTQSFVFRKEKFIFAQNAFLRKKIASKNPGHLKIMKNCWSKFLNVLEV